MFTTRTVFHSGRCQTDRITALKYYATSRGCRVQVERALNRPPGTKIVTVTGALSQIWMVALCARIFARGIVDRAFRLGEFAA